MSMSHFNSEDPRSVLAPPMDLVERLVAMCKAGQHGEAEPHLRQFTLAYPNHLLGWVLFATVLRSQKKDPEAMVALRHAVSLAPNDPILSFNLGNVLRDGGQAVQARDCYQRSIDLQPQFAKAHFQLGSLQQDAGLWVEAERSYRQCILYEPTHVDALVNLAYLLQDQGRFEQAFSVYRKALKVAPDNPILHYNQADLLHDMGRLKEAQSACLTALKLAPQFAAAHNNLGTILKDLGDHMGALKAYRQSLALAPLDTDAHSNLLFCMNYMPDLEAGPRLEQAKQYGQVVRDKATQRFTAWHCAEDAQRLKVGLVSGDFRTHPVGYFLENFIAHVDPSRIELVAFSTQVRTDALTSRIRPFFKAWLSLAGLADEVAANLIHQQGIHVLLDLSGHTAGNRLPVFAHKPAPVQASWLGYFATTGVAEIDHLVADPWTLPEPQEARFVEHIWRLPRTRLCFSAPTLEVPVTPLPAVSAGVLTFGCFSNISKINDEVVALWARLLLHVPGSRLLLKAKQLGDPTVQHKIKHRFERHGVAPERLLLEGPEPRAAYLAAYGRVDMGLDTWPFPGGTTTAESLWMGVPVLTLAGEEFLSRQGSGMMRSVGLEDWVATSSEDYLRLAAQKAADLDALGQLRAGLRERALRSPLFDAAQFARDFEDAMRGMWQHHLKHRGPT